MPALLPTKHFGTVFWLGRVEDREAALASNATAEISLSFSGVEGEAHGGLTRPSCSRVTAQYARGTEIRNTRQLSVLSREELEAIAADIGVAELDPSLVGATMVIEGIPDLSHVPPSSRLQGENGATLVVDMQNRPCTLPSPYIEAVYPGFGSRFKAAAKDRRGVTAWVEREGIFRLGEKVRLHVPDQRAWAGTLA